MNLKTFQEQAAQCTDESDIDALSIENLNDLLGIV